jgi:hypothetical protein
MTGMTTLRHNIAGGLIYRTLAKGGFGASAMAMQDIGRHNAAGDGEQAWHTIRTRLPPELTALMEGEERISRPDILIAYRLDIPSMAEIHIVEIKYCRDTDRTSKQQEGAAQHEVLARKLREKYPGKVRLHVITLGVTGTIYTDMIEMLTDMKVAKREALRCAAKLHEHAIDYVQRIMQTKWNQEHMRQHRDAG